ncbi:hypothetical protein RFI_02883 [Reticulomyxa filosa]|uniref:WD-40 repeat protein n=1 Tax=Reticulomyxa filosa TaxID=46433 RepID=X6P997_RETFI|nr:hypothetical protein RFI_02883 [Reticulomyxa filosa]|eukprot:ETO34212.1 hypothetical protein RFI_02883 [Reticulomyxa filosa]
MTTHANEKQTSMHSTLSKEKEIQLIIQYWIRTLKIKLGWINDFDNLVVQYVMSFLLTNIYLLIFKVWSIDYSTLDNNQFIYSGSSDNTVRVWDIENNKQIQSFNEHSNAVDDTTIRFWDVKNNQQLQIFNKHTSWINCIVFSPFNGGRYLCSGSADKTICLWDVETSNLSHIFSGRTRGWCIDISPLQSNNKNDNKSNSIGAIGGNGYTICSESWDKTICILDIETTKELNVFKGHEHFVRSVKYGSNELLNIILSGSVDKSIRLWDIRSMTCVEYSPFIVDNIEIGSNSNVICSGSDDNTIRFWDVRSNKNELYIFNGDKKEGEGIMCFKFVSLKKKRKNNEQKSSNCCVSLCYGSIKGLIYVGINAYE